MSKSRNLLTRSVVAAALFAAGPVALAAQEGFMFRRPVVTLAFRAGASVPAANDDLFNFITEQLTVDREDFTSVSWGGDVAIWLSSRADLVLGVSHARSSKRSEFRDLIGTDNLPIEQTTEFKRTPATVSLRFFPIDRGRSVGRYAWVPVNLLPYAGVGGGIMWYQLEQFGEFVDFETDAIFTDTIEDSGNTGMVQLFGGAEWWATTHVGLTVEGRYAWASAQLNDGFRDFDNINLRGFQLTLGLATRF
jgi:hypothetical protein